MKLFSSIRDTYKNQNRWNIYNFSNSEHKKYF